jgi:hypothetical protein
MIRALLTRIVAVTDTTPDVNPVRTSPLRVTAGVLLAVTAAIITVCFVWGVWNPQRYVLLLTWFGNPVQGLFAIAATVATAVWLLAPVRNEAAQNVRNSIRWLLLVVAVATGLCFLGVFETDFFKYHGKVLSRSADGKLALALVDRGRYGLDVRVWSGSGLAMRDLGGFGRVCGEPVQARFTAPDQVFISTNYGDFRMRVDATGRPATHKGDTCSS